jgi:hypothetical protein
VGVETAKLPQLETVENIMLSMPESRAMYSMLERVLNSQTLRTLTVSSSKLLLDTMCAMLPTDARLRLRDVLPPDNIEGGAFIMREWEARIDQAGLWDPI